MDETLLKLELRRTRGELGACLGAPGGAGFQSLGAGDSGRSGKVAIGIPRAEFDLQKNCSRFNKHLKKDHIQNLSNSMFC